MKPKTDTPTIKQRRTRAANTQKQDAAWAHADERLDEALRQTFPASDALSITQKSRAKELAPIQFPRKLRRR